LVRWIRDLGIEVVNPNIGATYDSGIWNPDNAPDALEGDAYFICI